jgi:hypothetical protein
MTRAFGGHFAEPDQGVRRGRGVRPTGIMERTYEARHRSLRSRLGKELFANSNALTNSGSRLLAPGYFLTAMG